VTSLLLVETARAAEWTAIEKQESHIVVALSPWAEVKLADRRVPFIRPEDHVDAAARRTLGLQNFDRVRRMTDALDSALTRNPILGGGKLRPGFAHYFWLKVALDAVSQRWLDLTRLIEVLQPSEIAYFPTPPRPGAERQLSFMGESIWALIAPLAAKCAGLEHQAVDVQPWHSLAGRSVSRGHRVAARLTQIASARLESIGRERTPDTGTILCLDLWLAKALISSGFRVGYWSARSGREVALSGRPRIQAAVEPPRALLAGIEDEGALAWDSLRADPAFQSNFEIAGYNLLPIFESRLNHLSSAGLRELARIYLIALHRLDRAGTGAVVARSFSEAPERAVAMAAHSAGVPVVSYDHGSMGYFDFPMDRYLDSSCVDVRLVWGDGVRRSVERRYPTGARPVAVGSLELDHLLGATEQHRRSARTRIRRRLKVPAGVPLVLYVVTSMSTNNAYESNLICSDSEYFRRQRQIVAAFRDHPEARLVVKLHPAPNQPQSPIVAWAREHGIVNVQFITQPPLDEMLDAADLFVNDSPTTTLLQMLTTECPILVLGNGGIVIEPEALQPLRNRVFYGESLEALEVELRRRLAAGDLGDRADDGSFLILYGTFAGDGRSADRVARAIREASSAKEVH
jgi:hypothetical protein